MSDNNEFIDKIAAAIRHQLLYQAGDCLEDVEQGGLYCADCNRTFYPDLLALAAGSAVAQHMIDIAADRAARDTPMKK